MFFRGLEGCHFLCLAVLTPQDGVTEEKRGLEAAESTGTRPRPLWPFTPGLAARPAAAQCLEPSVLLRGFYLATSASDYGGSAQNSLWMKYRMKGKPRLSSLAAFPYNSGPCTPSFM